MKRKEILWFTGTIVFIVTIYISLFGVNALTLNSTIDINIHDTYFVMDELHLMLLLVVIIFFIVYLLRMLISNFKNDTANLIFIIACIFMIMVVGFVNSAINSLSQFTSTTVYPPLSSPTVEERINGFGIWLIVLNVIQVFLLVLLAYSGFKTGTNYKQQTTE